MFKTAKPYASLSSGLLASKGQARPAMRSQGFGGMVGPGHPGTSGLDDLGWNDMGTSEPAVQQVVAAPVQPIAPAVPEDMVPEAKGSPDVPPVLIEREALKNQVETPAVVKPVSVPTATRLRRETQHAGRAAFTLRVDADRHLRLRLATALTNRSAQDLVTEALDVLLGSVPEVEALVAQLPPAKRTR